MNLNKIILKNIEGKVLNTISKAELSRRMGILPQSLHHLLKNLEKGRGITTTTVEKIATAVGIAPVELLEI